MRGEDLIRPTVFFDWNGTLFADTRHCWKSTNHALKMFNLGPVSYDKYVASWAFPIAELYLSLGCDADELHEREKELYSVWGETYEHHVRRARLRRGARSVLQTLNERDHEVLILSNHTVEKINTHTKRLGIHSYFSTILANGEDRRNFKHRDKGDRLGAYLNRKHNRQALVVGDTPEEIEIARHHGIVSVALTHGQCSLKRLRAAKPDFLIHNLTEIPAIAQKVFKGHRGRDE